MLKNVFAAGVITLMALFSSAPVLAASPGEAFISTNVQKGLNILNDQALSQDQKRTRFQEFLLSVTDMKRIARYTLGKYAATAAPQDVDAFSVAFQDYAIQVYQSFFNSYSGQTLTVIGSVQRTPTDEVIKTRLTDPAAKGPGIEVDFRVLSDKGAPAIMDLNVAGIWLGLSQQAQFAAILDKNGGSIPDLIANLGKITAQYR